MEDTNVRIQAYLQTKKQIIFDLHVNQKRSINEVHRELVHHQDPWFTYSQLSHAVGKWKEQEPELWKRVRHFAPPTHRHGSGGGRGGHREMPSPSSTGQAPASAGRPQKRVSAPAAPQSGRASLMSTGPDPAWGPLHASTPQGWRPMATSSIGVGMTGAHKVETPVMYYDFNADPCGLDGPLEDLECTTCGQVGCLSC